jgi:hypothetical protein
MFRHLLADVLREDVSLEDLGKRFADSAAGRIHADSLRLGAKVWEVSRRGEAARRHATDVLASVSRLFDAVAYAPSSR